MPVAYIHTHIYTLDSDPSMRKGDITIMTSEPQDMPPWASDMHITCPATCNQHATWHAPAYRVHTYAENQKVTAKTYNPHYKNTCLSEKPIRIGETIN